MTPLCALTLNEFSTPVTWIRKGLVRPKKGLYLGAILPRLDGGEYLRNCKSVFYALIRVYNANIVRLCVRVGVISKEREITHISPGGLYYIHRRAYAEPFVA